MRDGLTIGLSFAMPLALAVACGDDPPPDDEPDAGCPPGTELIDYRGETECRTKCRSSDDCADDAVCTAGYCLEEGL